ncbi:hypothetical protein [Gallaecimonas pentaromativorans]|uniref:hypothetical protein n=1 Tax=Gallaecimonas pentaromativorans TaxID=584787 RepID=UPI003A947EA8
MKIENEEWIDRWDMSAVPDFDDKLKECEFFFGALSLETDRNRFRWLVSAFLSAAYSFFESTALTAHFRYSDPENGDPYEDSEGLRILRKHVEVKQSQSNPEYVKTKGLTPITKQLYEFRKKNTHHLPLSVMVVDSGLPEGFQFGSIQGQGTPVMPLCRQVMDLIRTIHDEIGY